MCNQVQHREYLQGETVCLFVWIIVSRQKEATTGFSTLQKKRYKYICLETHPNNMSNEQIHWSHTEPFKQRVFQGKRNVKACCGSFHGVFWFECHFDTLFACFKLFSMVTSCFFLVVPRLLSTPFALGSHAERNDCIYSRGQLIMLSKPGQKKKNRPEIPKAMLAFCRAGAKRWGGNINPPFQWSSWW